MAPTSLRPGLAVAVAALTVALMLARPRGLAEGTAAAAGGGLTVMLGLTSGHAALATLTGSWNVLLFFAGLMAVAGLADEAGLFRALARLAVRRSRGSPVRLLVAVLAGGAVVTALLSNDATVLLLTPVVAAVVLRLGLDPLPYALAASFIADAASALLPVANPVNILVVDAFHVGLGEYLRVLLLPALAVTLVTGGMVVLLMRGRLRRQRSVPVDPGGADGAPAPPAMLRPALAALSVLAVAYTAATAARVPVGPVACGGAALLAAVVPLTPGGGVGRLARLRRDVSPSVLLLVAGLFVVVRGLEDTGVTGTVVGHWLAPGGAGAGSALRALGGAALGSNVVNNLPMTLVAVSGLHGTPHPTVPALAAALGADVGPNLTPIGSLATLLWLVLLRARGIEVGPRAYVAYGVAVTVPALAAAAACLLLTAR